MNGNNDQNLKPTVGSIVAHSWWLFITRPLLFLAWACAAGLLNQLLRSLAISFGFAFSPFYLLNTLLISIVIDVLLAFLVYSAHNAMKNEKNTLDTLAAPVFRRLGPLLLMDLITGLVFTICNLLMSKLLFTLLASNIWPFLTINALVNAAIGTFWVAAIPLCLIENRGPIDSLIGSVRLVKKHWLTVFTLVVAVSLIRATVLFFIESHFPGGFGGLLSGFHLIGFPLSAFLLSFKYVMFIVIYYDLSDWRDQRRLAGVFNAA